MRILVTGNGFDLAHELPTSYSSFLDFYKALMEYHSTNSCYDPYYSFFEKFKYKPLYDEIINHINKNNRLLNYFWDIYEKRCADGKRGWIDFESEISTVIKALDEARRIRIKYKLKAYKHLPPNVLHIAEKVLLVDGDGSGKAQDFPDGFEEGRVDELLDDFNRLTRLLEIYLVEYVGSINVKNMLPECKDLDVTHVISFNYTDTYQKLYDADGKADYCYVHGKIESNSSIEKCKIVLGIDEYLTDQRRDQENTFVWFKKFYQRIFKGTGSEYIDWINSSEKNAARFKESDPPINNVYIYGHSLDVTDKDILTRLILMKNTKTHIFYYSNTNLAKEIENLIKLIGEDELIRRTGGENRTICFIDTRR